MIWIYLVTLISFLGIDAVWLRTVMSPLFNTHIGAFLREEIKMGAALGFYALYVAGIMYLATVPALRAGLLGEAALKGAVLGFLAYGTYEATNMATIKGWSWSMVATDVAWGTFLTALTAVVGYLVAPWLGWES
ncbi:DUF2177 family protein [Algicella marina]|uniref:DUF2177 family protein n=1 Tax=Algicella marina TaxID=2683284 RepID=A0A6P1T5S9_9RHOB|nr:DUF2177 family protein [Algicella marina]QHQ37397.1 DUF2177 family protein [Algicella marina]